MPGLGDLDNRVLALETKVQQLAVENQQLRKWMKQAMRWQEVFEPLPSEPEDTP